MYRVRAVLTTLLLVVSVAISPVVAQGGGFGKVQGHVIDTARHSIANATVLIVGTQLRARTDAQGAYQIDSIPAGIVEIRAQYVGYKPLDLAGVRIPGGKTLEDMNFRLEPSPVSLRPVSQAASAAGASSMLLRFQLIRPIATRTTDKALMPIDSVLRDLFQWPGYQLLAQSALTLDMPMRIEWGGTGASTSTQTMLNVEGNAYDLSVRADTTEFAPQRVKLTVSLVGLSHAAATKSVVATPADRKTLLSTTVTVNLGRTVVLGSTQPGGGRGGMSGTLILTVSPAMAKPN